MSLIPGSLRVQAVTAGYYGEYRYPGDVFDLKRTGDFSDSTVNYQAAGGEVGYGWMLSVPANTPLYSWIQSNDAPALPVGDPARRTVY